jgi:hypothetical protein
VGAGTWTSAGLGVVLAGTIGIGLSPTALGSARGEAGSPVHRTCPKAARHTARSHEPDADHALLPRGARAVLICRYHGANPRARFLRLDSATLIVRAASVADLEQSINDAKPFLPDVPYLCPRDTGPKTMAFFRYGDAHEVAILIRPEGCPTVSNGRLLRMAEGVVSIILRLTG